MATNLITATLLFNALKAPSANPKAIVQCYPCNDYTSLLPDPIQTSETDNWPSQHIIHIHFQQKPVQHAHRH